MVSETLNLLARLKKRQRTKLFPEANCVFEFFLIMYSIPLEYVLYVVATVALARLLMWLKGPTLAGLPAGAPGYGVEAPAAYVPRGDEKGTRITSVNPATGQVVGEELCFSKEDVEHCVRLSRAASEAWAQTSFAERRAVFRDLMDEVLRLQDDLCRASVDGTGKTMMEATYAFSTLFFLNPPFFSNLLPVMEKL